MENIEIGLSEEGKRAINDNTINYTDLITFSEEDIKDLFKNFRDRMAVRKHLNTLKSPKSTVSDTDSLSQTVESIESADETDDNNDACTSAKESSCFTAEELLEKKDLRGKSSPAQKYFNNLIKDAATAAKIWKKPYPNLDSIPKSKTETFFNIIEESLPGVLATKKKLVWQRLGQHLQNRRKYLKDKESGKRVLKGQKSDVAESSSSNTSLKRMFFNPGDIVMLKDKNGNMIGKAIFLQQSNELYSEVVIKTITDTLTDMELPEKTGDGISDFKNLKVKTVITYWTKYITKEKALKRKRSRTATLDEHEKGEDTDSDVSENPTATQSSTPNVEKGGQRKQGKSKSDSIKKIISSYETEASVSDIVDSDSDLEYVSEKVVAKKSKRRKDAGKTKNPKCSDRTMKTPNPKATESSRSKAQCEYDTFVLMEWQNGKLFWGIKSGPINNCTVQNTVKSCGKISENKIDYEAIYQESQDLKLSILDIQALPDMRFCVMEIPKSLSSDYGIQLTDSGTIRIEEGSKEKFLRKLQEDFTKYISELE